MTNWNDLKVALSLREFEPQRWRDWLRVAVAPIRFAAAWLEATVWVTVLRNDHMERLFHAWSEAGYPGPVICSRCLWAGSLRSIAVRYSDDGSDAECPLCGRLI